MGHSGPVREYDPLSISIDLTFTPDTHARERHPDHPAVTWWRRRPAAERRGIL